MKYFSVLLTIFMTLTTYVSASDPVNDEREQFRATAVAEAVNIERSSTYPSVDAMKSLVLAKAKISWNTYNGTDFFADHQAALKWFQQLSQDGQINQLANSYQAIIREGKQVSSWEAGLWPAAVEGYKTILNVSSQNNTALPEEGDWSKAPYHVTRGTLKKHNVLLTYLATAFIDVRKDLRTQYVQAMMTAYDS